MTTSKNGPKDPTAPRSWLSPEARRELRELRDLADAAEHSLWSRRVEAREALYRAAHSAVPQLLDEVQRLHNLFASFQLECCDDWSCAESHALKTIEAITQLRAQLAESKAEVERLRELRDGARAREKALCNVLLREDEDE